MSSTARAPSAFAPYTMYSSTTKSLRSTGVLTARAISARYSSRPRNQNGSVKHDIAAAPAASYSRATATGSMSGAIMPFEGEAFLTSAITCTPGRESATSNGKLHGAASRAARNCSSFEGPPSAAGRSAAHAAQSRASMSSAARRMLSSGRTFFSAATRSRVLSAISSRMDIAYSSPPLLARRYASSVRKAAPESMSSRARSIPASRLSTAPPT